MEQASVGDRFTLGGESRLVEQPAQEDGRGWQLFLLWGVLILGVAGLGLFAVKIWREMKQKSANPEN